MYNFMSGAAFAATLSLAPVIAWSADYPTAPVTFMVASTAGTSTDTMTRAIADDLSKTTGQSFLVENLPGASGVIGMVEALGREADGYTVMIGTVSSMAGSYSLLKSVPYTPDSFEPVTCLYTTPVALAVRTGLDINTLEDLVAYAKANPGKLKYGWGSAVNKVGAEIFKSAAGVDIRAIAYKSAPQAMVDMLGGRIDVVVDVPIQLTPFAAQDQVKILGVASAERIPSLPDVPTMAEGGVEGVLMEPWYAAYVKAGTDEAIRTQLKTLLDAAVVSPSGEKFATSANAVPMHCSADELKKFTLEQVELWRGYVAQAGIPAQ